MAAKNTSFDGLFESIEKLEKRYLSGENDYYKMIWEQLFEELRSVYKDSKTGFDFGDQVDIKTRRIILRRMAELENFGAVKLEKTALKL